MKSRTYVISSKFQRSFFVVVIVVVPWCLACGGSHLSGASWLQDGCCNSSHHFYVPGRKMRKRRGQSTLSVELVSFIWRFPQNSAQQFPPTFSGQNCDTWPPFSAREPGKYKFTTGDIITHNKNQELFSKEEEMLGRIQPVEKEIEDMGKRV